MLSARIEVEVENKDDAIKLIKELSEEAQKLSLQASVHLEIKIK